MKKSIGLFLVVFMVSLISCNDDCDEGDKPTPASFFVEITDETTDENVFENETYTFQQITIVDANDETIPFEFIENNNLIQIFPPIANETGNTFTIRLNNETTMQSDEISTTYDVSSQVGECFTTFKIENILFPNNTSNLVEGVYVIKI